MVEVGGLPAGHWTHESCLEQTGHSAKMMSNMANAALLQHCWGQRRLDLSQL